MGINRYLRIAEETDYATMPGTPDWKDFDIASSDLSGPTDQVEQYQTVAARNPRFYGPGIYTIDGSFALPVDHKLFGHILLGVMGNVTSSQIETTDFYEHEFTSVEEILSYVLAVGKDEFEHQFLGVLLNELSLELTDRFLIATVSCLGAKDAKDDLSTVEVANMQDFVFNAIVSSATRGQTDLSAKIRDFSLSFNNNVDVEGGIPVTERFPVDYIAQAIEVTVDMTLIFDSADELEAYWGDSTGPAEKELAEEELSIEFVEVADEKELGITLPKAICQAHSAPIETRDRIEQSVTYQGFTDSDGDAVKFKLINDEDGTYYNNA